MLKFLPKTNIKSEILSETMNFVSNLKGFVQIKNALIFTYKMFSSNLKSFVFEISKDLKKCVKLFFYPYN